MRTGIYTRISQDKRGDALGVERQEAECRVLCERLGWEVVDLYSDNDISATTGKRRPAYDRLLADVTSGDLDAIVAWHPDRLYRVLPDLEPLVETVQKHHVEIATVTAGTIDLATPTGRMVARILGAVATQEGEHKAERWRAKYDQARKAGQPFRGGPRPFGWTRDGEIVPTEAAALRDAARTILAGGSLLGIVRRLNAAGFRTTMDREWTTRSLKLTLTNPRMAGWATRDRGEIVTVDGEQIRSTDPAILSDGEWRAVVARFNVNAQRYGSTVTPRKSPLLGILFCGRCGNRLSSSSRSGTARTGDPDRDRMYRCVDHDAGTKGCGLSISAAPVEAIARGFTDERLSDPRVLAALNAIRAAGNDKARRLSDEIAGLEARRDEIDQAMRSRSGGSVLALADARDDLDSQIDEARRRLLEISPDAPLATIGPWPQDVEAQRARIRTMVARIDVHPTSPTMRGKFDPDRVVIVPALDVSAAA